MAEQSTLIPGADSEHGLGNERRDSGIANMDVLGILNTKLDHNRWSMSLQESADVDLDITLSPPTPGSGECCSYRIGPITAE